MKVIGITSGIGSMLIAAKQMGAEVLGNIEWRRYYHARDADGKNTFEEYFKAPQYKKLEDMTDEQIEEMTGADIAFGHPECGNFSTMSATVQQKDGKTLDDMRKDAGDIPVFVDLIKKLKPKYFVQDNLPKSLIGYSIEQWAEALPEYDLFPEWISNWGYGNVQKYRKRFFMIGALKSEKFVFHPHEIEQTSEFGLADFIQNLPEADSPLPHAYANHEPHTREGGMSKGAGLFGPDPMTWAQYREFMLREKEGVTITYLAKDGTWKSHVGWRKGFKYGYVPVITGGCPIANPFTGLPFSIRERCRIQGLPDDFVIYGTKVNEDGTWNHSKNSSAIKQTGKCMPVQFCRYVTEQILYHIGGNSIVDEPLRTLNHNPLITEAKQWYCYHVGYGPGQQRAACNQCWIKDCEHANKFLEYGSL